MKIMNDIKINKYELILSEDCNLRCKYCFDNYLSDREAKCLSENIMNIDILPNLFLFIDNTMSKKDAIYFNLFGGEPLTNWDFFQKFVIETRKRYGYKNVNISTVTNATLLNSDKIDFMSAFKVDVAISLDGIKDANINRIDRSGNDTWEKVVKILPEVVAKIPNINIFMVVNKENYHYLYNSYKFLLNFNVSVEILVDMHNDWIDNNIMDEIEATYNQLFIIEKVTPFRSLLKFMYNTYVENSDNMCGNVNNTISINPKGEIFFCHQFIPKLGNIDSKLSYGNIKDGYINTDIYNNFLKRTKFTEWSQDKTCINCESKNWCKGGCIAEHYNYKNRDINSINPNICKYNNMLNIILKKLKS